MTSPAPQIPKWVAVVFAVIAGALMTVQVRVNGELAVRIESSVLASVISFGSGFLILCVIMAFSRTSRRGFRTLLQVIRTKSLSGWFTLAGFVGAFFVLSQGLALGVIGVALFTVAFVAGLLVGGLFLDLWGVGPAGKRPLSWLRLAATFIAIAAVTLSVSDRVKETNQILTMLMPLTIGVFVAWQQAANGRITKATGTPITTTWVNFMVGTGTLLLCLLALIPWVPAPSELPALFSADYWFYIGGACGVIFVSITSVVVRVVGLLVVSIATTIGQLFTSIVLSILWPGGNPLTWALCVGSAMLIVAIVLAALPSSQHEQR